MIRSTMSFLALSSVFALAAAGCSHDNRPANTPETDTFQSNVGSSQYGDQYGQSAQGQQGTMGTMSPNDTSGTHSTDVTGMSNQPNAQQGANGQYGTNYGSSNAGQANNNPSYGNNSSSSNANNANESSSTTDFEVCNDLSSNAKISVQNITNGVMIVLRPTSSGDLATLKDRAHQVERHITSGASNTPSQGASCALFDFAKGDVVNVTEGTDNVKIDITTTSKSDVGDLRKNAQAWAKATPNGGSSYNNTNKSNNNSSYGNKNNGSNYDNTNKNNGSSNTNKNNGSNYNNGNNGSNDTNGSQQKNQ